MKKIDAFKSVLSCLLLTTTTYGFTAPVAPVVKSLCVFDIGGTLGNTYLFAREYVLQSAKMGVNFEPKVYRNEDEAYNDFTSKKCDAVILTSMRTRIINPFSGSTDTIGALPTAPVAKTVLRQLNSQQYATKMVTPNGYEVAGILPLGTYYLFVGDRSINNIAKLIGRKIGVMPYDQSQARLVTRIGAQPVTGSPQKIASLFNEGKLDAVPLPVIAYGPLQLEKGMKSGGVGQFPLGYLTASIILNRATFPASFGQKSRVWVNGQLDPIFNQISQSDSQIPAKYWIPLPATEKESYIKLMREARVSLTRQGFFDAQMMSIAKQARCKYTPNASECSTKDE